ncbi:MAG: hypothetical protein LBF16_07430 [Pseudomonadales bacterium]|jgi:hypothetical protein|nr:hypothetical protein [Pseudomonadales bacterium]
MSKAENAPRMNTNAGSVWRGGCIPLALQLALLAALLVTVVLLVLTTHRHLDIRQEHAHSQAGVVALQPAAAVEQPLRNESRREDGLRTDVPVVTSASAPAAQVVSDSGLGDLRAFGRKAWGSLLLVAAACLGGVLLIGIWAARCISAPIRNLALALDRLSAGQQARVTVAGAPEVR